MQHLPILKICSCPCQAGPKGRPCFVFLYFLYEQIPARGALIALDLTHFAPVEAASSGLPAAFQKENTILTDGVSFCDCPQVLLSALPPTARKGECEGGTFDGFPHSRSITRLQATTFASKSAAPKKKGTHVGVFLFWSGRRGSTRYRHPTNGRAIRRSPAGPLDLTRCAQVEAASSSLPAAFQKENTILTDGVSFWSGRRGSNSLPRPWQGRALPDELRPQTQGEL